MLDVTIPLVIGTAIGASGVCAWALGAAKKIREKEDKPFTDREAVKAVNTIKGYCDGRCCQECVIRRTCGKYFDNSLARPYDWPELEVTHHE